MMHIVYLITNLTNEKYYVGFSSRSLETRWREHCYPSAAEENRHLSRAIRKDGSNSFHAQIIALVESEKEAINLEKLWIRLLSSYDPKFGYNLTLGGDGLGCPSQQTRKKMSNSHKGKTPSEVTLEKRRISLKNAWVKRKERGDHLLSIPQLLKNAAAMKGKTYTQIYGAYRADREATSHSVGLVASAKNRKKENSQLPPVSRVESSEAINKHSKP